jgi:DNA-binding response OmpR family regulator
MKKILIAEDDVLLGDAITKKLISAGFEAILARDGLEGYQKMKSAKPDLLLLDIVLPGMDGYEMLEKKREDPKIAKIPVIIVSNSGQPVEINRALALGVKDYVVKAQFDPDEVLAKIKALMRKDEELASPVKSLEDEMKQGENHISLNGKKILWVEDDQFLNDIITRKLSTAECVFFHASEGEEALRIVNDEIPDIIMLDILLSGMDGFEILRQVKNNPKTKHIPVILLSNLGQESDIKKGKSLGAELFLIKATVTPNEIVDKIKEVLAQHNTQTAND